MNYKIKNHNLNNMKINTTLKLKDLKGNDLMISEKEPLTIGESISNILSQSEGNKLKMFILAQKFATNDEVEIDTSDFALVKKAIEDTKLYIALITGQILLILEDIK